MRSSIKPINNMVVVRPVSKDIMRTLPGTKLVLGVPSAAKDQYLKNYAHRHFEVIAVPDKLVIPNSRRLLSAQGAAITWSTSCEIKPKDIVWVQLRAGQAAHRLVLDGEEVYLVNYCNLYVAQRRIETQTKKSITKDGLHWRVIPLNGYIICETVQEITKSTLLLLVQRKKLDDRLRIVHIGKPVDYYFGLDSIGHFKKTSADRTPLKEGDLLLPRLSGMPGSRFFINIEGEYFHDFNGKNQLVAIERRFISAYEVPDTILPS